MVVVTLFNHGKFFQCALEHMPKDLWNLSTSMVFSTLIFFHALSLFDDLIMQRKLSCTKTYIVGTVFQFAF